MVIRYFITMNKNVQTLAQLYDAANKQLAFVFERNQRMTNASQTPNTPQTALSDPLIQEQIRMIGEIGRALLVVHQIESARDKPSVPNGQPSAGIPATPIQPPTPRVRPADNI